MQDHSQPSSENTTRRLSGNVVAAMFHVVASSLLLFELYRFVVSQIGTAQVGVWSLVMATAAAARLGEAGLGGGVVKFVSHDLGAGRPDRAVGTITMASSLIGALMLLLCVLLWPLTIKLLATILPDEQTVAAGKVLLPWALGSLWLTAVSNVFAGALDAARRTDLRAFALTFAGAAQLVGAYVLVPRYGLMALGPVQGIAALVTFLTTITTMTVIMKQPLSAWTQWSKPRLKELFSYGGAFQLGALGQLAFEPTVKWLLGAFGNLTLSGYFELANRAISQMRLLIAAAYQMLVPHVSTRIGREGINKDAIQSTYKDASRLLLLIALPYYTLIACLLPAFLTLWISEYSVNFITIGLLCLLGWTANTFAIPAFVVYLSVGKLRWNVVSQLVVGALNLVLAGSGGYFFGGIGVVAGAMCALALGTLVVTIAFHHEYQVRLADLLTARLAVLLVLGVVAVSVALWITMQWHGKGFPPWHILMSTATYLVLATPVIWHDPWLRQKSVAFRQHINRL